MTDAVTTVVEQHPPPHTIVVVNRRGWYFTATPCYGMHVPWWVVKTMGSEAEPVPMLDDDEWMSVPAVSQCLAELGANR